MSAIDYGAEDGYNEQYYGLLNGARLERIVMQQNEIVQGI